MESGVAFGARLLQRSTSYEHLRRPLRHQEQSSAATTCFHYSLFLSPSRLCSLADIIKQLVWHLQATHLENPIPYPFHPAPFSVFASSRVENSSILVWR